MCKSLRKGEAARAGSEGLRMLPELSVSLLEANGRAGVTPGLGATVDVVEPGRVKRESVEELRVASGVWLWARRDVKGLGVSGFVAGAPKTEEEPKVRPDAESLVVDAGCLGLYREVGLSAVLESALLSASVCPVRKGDGLFGGRAMITPVPPEFRQRRQLPHAVFPGLRCL